MRWCEGRGVVFVGSDGFPIEVEPVIYTIKEIV